MKTSAAGRAAITRREGNVLKAYKDSVGILTIGVGHTSMAGPPKVTAGLKITAEESDEILSRDLAKFEAAVEKAVKVPVSQNEFDALVSLAFNIGGGAFAKSTLVRKLNAGDRKGAADAFMSWNKAGGKTLKGLTTRRQDERKQFLQNAPLPKESAVETIALTKGDHGPAVVTLQTNLTLLGYTTAITGYFDDGTEKTVRAFQKDNDLKVDGAAGVNTNTKVGELLKNREVKPKLTAAKKIVNEAAAPGKTISTTEIAAGVAGLGGVATAADNAKQSIDSATSLYETLVNLGPWILVALVIVGAAGYIYWDRRNKRLNAREAQEVIAE